MISIKTFKFCCMFWKMCLSVNKIYTKGLPYNLRIGCIEIILGYHTCNFSSMNILFVEDCHCLKEKYSNNKSWTKVMLWKMLRKRVKKYVDCDFRLHNFRWKFFHLCYYKSLKHTSTWYVVSEFQDCSVSLQDRTCVQNKWNLSLV